MKRSIQVLALFSVVILGSSVLWAQDWPGAQQQVDTTAVQQCPNDANGDGVCDVCGQPAGSHANQGKGRRGNGPGDGSGNQGNGPKDGSGYGSGSGNGNGNCDGTGPRGNQGGRGNGGRGGRGGRR